MKSNRVLVLGATGFIGKKLVIKLKEHYPKTELIAFNGESDISNKSIIQKIISLHPEIIVIAAGKTFVPDSWKTPVDFYNVNTIGALNIAEAARMSKSKIVFLSTFVYGEPYRLPIKETNAVRPFNPYASSKFLAEQTFKDYFRFFGVETNVLRVFNVYGQDQNSDFLIPTLIRQYNEGKQIQVKDLKPKRDYIHVDDLVDAIIAAMSSFNGYEVYNAASGKSFSVSDLIELIFKLGLKKIPVFSEEQTRSNEVMDTRADISKIQSKLNWSPRITIEKGLLELLH
jgi:nucleoside-diphosphate-sugar epimerase